MMKALLVLVCYFGTMVASGVNPLAAFRDDLKVYRIRVKDVQQFETFKKLRDNLPLHYINELKGPGFWNDIVIDPENQDKLEAQLRLLELEFHRVVEDLQSILNEENETVSPFGNLTKSTKMDWTKYHDLPVIYSWLNKIETENSSLVTPYTIGYSYEGRPIRAIKISSKAGNKAIFIDSSIHAIEWISSAATTCFFDNLLKSSDERMKNLLQNYDWIFVPVVNPDGFEYSHNVFRLWRKNRKPTGCAGLPCIGTDLNRNFDYKWAAVGFSLHDPCAHWYCGNEAASEPEVRAFKSFFNNFQDGYIRMYMAFHSYGNKVLLPYGYTRKEFPKNYDQMMRIATAFADGARVKYGTNFKSGSSGLLSYLASGTAKDWVYAVKKINFSATMELRDSGFHGFFLPPSQILEVCAEISDGLVTMVDKAKEEGLFD